MARQTRQQRRARRAQGIETAPAGGPPAPPPVRPVANGGAQPERRPPPPAERRRAPGFGFVRFVQEAMAELKKVEWPDQKAVIGGTVVVLVACVIVGAWLYANDRVWQYVVQHVLLR
ncbi:MAG: SecE/Sec61-gamma subunit of protein translocation complex [Actinomycetota bacterium]|jgi:preprotein translocase SecE subunit